MRPFLTFIVTLRAAVLALVVVVLTPAPALHLHRAGDQSPFCILAQPCTALHLTSHLHAGHIEPEHSCPACAAGPAPLAVRHDVVLALAVASIGLESGAAPPPIATIRLKGAPSRAPPRILA